MRYFINQTRGENMNSLRYLQADFAVIYFIKLKNKIGNLNLK